MKGFLPFLGRYLSPRYLFLPILVLLYSATTVQAKTVVIGAGFGNVTVSNMNGLNPGDVLAITPGQYTGGTFGHLKGITITNNGGAVIFSGMVALSSLVECTFTGFQFKNVAGTAIRWDGNSRRCVERNIYFNNVSGSANDAQDHNPYTGDTSSLKLYIVTFDSLTLFKTDLLMQASFGNTVSNICFVDSIIISRIKIDSTSSNGTEVRGVFFRMNAYDWRVTYKGINTVLGDVGIFQMVGNGSFHNIYRFGGRGYIMRLWNAGLGSVGNSYFYNNIDLSSTVYGTIGTEVITPDQHTQYCTGGNTYVYNNTSGNKDDNINYWASMVVIGYFPAPYICSIKNNLSFNLTTRGKPPICMDQSSGTWVPDSAKNLYFNSATGVVDPITGMPVTNSPVIGKGLTIPWILDDLYHSARLGAYDVGAVQHGGAIIPPPPNVPPVAGAGAAQTITLPVSNTTLDGSKSYDPDGTISKYAWTLVSGTGGTITNASSVSTTVTGLTQGTYIYKLTVTDNSNASTSVLDTIIVKAAANLPPIANAGADQTITLPVSNTTVDGSASKDQDNGGLISTYAWSQSSGPSAAVIGTATKATSTLTGLQSGTYVFKLTVTDNSGATAIDSITINVIVAANIPPVANAGTSKSITLPVNTVNLDGSLSTDADGTIISYSWAQISGPSASSITNATASATAANNLVAGQYIFELTVKDNGGASTKAQVKITVVNSGLQPPIANAGANQTIVLPLNQVAMDGSASVAPSGNIVSYAWTQISGPSAATLTTAAAIQTNATGLVAGTYLFQLSIVDNNNVKAMDSITITVNPATNIPPVANAGASITIILPINTITLDGSKSGDADGTITTYSWTIISGPNTPGSSGANTASLSLTGLVAGQYNYQLTVTDNSGATSKAQVKITVVPSPNVLPVANAGPDQTITAPSNSVNLNGSASNDPDGTITAFTWIMFSGQGSVTISNGNTATPAVTGLNPGTYVFQLTVKDNSGATNTDLVTITVKPNPVTPNQDPIANAGNNQTITAPVNSILLNGSSSFDPDGTITNYSWSEVSGPSTSTIAGNGTVSPTFSGLIVGTYVFQLQVTDNSGALNTDQISVTVQPAVANANQTPVARAGADTTIYLPANAIQLNALGSYDPDGSITSYQWQEINGPNSLGSLAMNSSLVDLSNLQEGVYEFQLTVTDNLGGTSTSKIKVSVDKGVGTGDQIIVFPNPAHDVLTSKITSTVNGAIKVNVYDMNGRIVMIDQSEKSLEVFEKSLNISSLATGMYTIQVIIGNKKTMITKFIKQ
jgi:hypothetical protein